MSSLSEVGNKFQRMKASWRHQSKCIYTYVYTHTFDHMYIHTFIKLFTKY